MAIKFSNMDKAQIAANAANQLARDRAAFALNGSSPPVYGSTASILAAGMLGLALEAGSSSFAEQIAANSDLIKKIVDEYISSSVATAIIAMTPEQRDGIRVLLDKLADQGG